MATVLPDWNWRFHTGTSGVISPSNVSFICNEHEWNRRRLSSNLKTLHRVLSGSNVMQDDTDCDQCIWVLVERNPTHPSGPSKARVSEFGRRMLEKMQR